MKSKKLRLFRDVFIPELRYERRLLKITKEYYFANWIGLKHRPIKS